MAKHALPVLLAKFLISELKHVLTAKINKNIFQTLINANKFSKNQITMQVKIGLPKMVIINQLIKNLNNFNLKVSQFNNVHLINPSHQKISNHVWLVRKNTISSQEHATNVISSSLLSKEIINVLMLPKIVKKILFGTDKNV
jgi:hypothetical protein